MQNSTSHIGLPFAAEHFTDPAAAVERVSEIYEANTAYWNPERIPGFAKLHMLLVHESRTRVAMLKRAEAELISLEPQDVRF